MRPSARVQTAVLCAAALVSLQVGVAAAQPDPGSLDTSFSGNGKARLNIATAAFCSLPDRHDSSGACEDSARSVSIDTQGRILVAGFSHDSKRQLNSAVVRYLPDGTLDSSFAGGGIKRFGGYDETEVATDSQDRPIVGSADPMRLNPDGTTDTSFGTNGTLQAPFGTALVLGGSDELTLAGDVNGTAYPDGIDIARYLPNGDPDPAFTTPPTVFFDDYREPRVTSIALDHQGGAIVAAELIDEDDPQSRGIGALVRFLPDGSLDASFSGDGMLTAKPRYQSLAFDSQGRIIATGGGVIDRYLPDGSRDTSFSGDGRVERAASMVAVDDRDRLIIAAQTIKRLLEDGSVDRGFGRNGLPQSANFEHPIAVAIDGEGRIVSAGVKNLGGSSGGDFTVARRFGGG